MKKHNKILLGIGAFGIALAGKVYTVVQNEKKCAHYASLSVDEVIKEIKTPEEAFWYVENYVLDGGVLGSTMPFGYTHKNRIGKCDDKAIAYIALLSDNGYGRNFAFLDRPGQRHAVFIQETTEGYEVWGNPQDNIKVRGRNLQSIADKLGYQSIELHTIKEKDMHEVIYGDVDLSLPRKGREFFSSKRF